MSDPSKPRTELPIVPALVVSSFVGGLLALGASALWRTVNSDNPPSDKLVVAVPPSGSPAVSPVAAVEFLPALTPAEQQIEAALDAPFDCDLQDTPLTDFVTLVGERSKIPVVFDDAALAEEAIAIDSPITRQLQKINLRSGLELILGPLHLSAVPQRERLVITTRTRGLEMMEARTYPVSDICRSAGQLGTPDLQALALLLQAGAVGQWMDRDGQGGEIAELTTTGSLTIRQTPQTHREIVAILRSLRQAQRQDIALIDPATLKQWDDQRAAVAKKSLPPLSPVAFAEVFGADLTDHRSKIESALSQSVSVSSQDEEVVQVVRQMTQRLGINLAVDEEAITEEGIPLKTPVRLNVDNVTARAALELVLKPLNLEAVNVGEVLVVTTVNQAAQQLVTRTYPVSDIAGPNGDYLPLISAIGQIQADTWAITGGSGTVTELPSTGSLVIVQTRPVHEEILRLLRDQRAAAGLNQNRPTSRSPRRNAGSATP